MNPTSTGCLKNIYTYEGYVRKDKRETPIPGFGAH